MKALITGSQGFVGIYLRQELEQNGYEVTGLDVQPGEKTIQADLLDAHQIAEVIADLKPEAIFHLAALADVGRSWKMPQLTVRLNVEAAVNLLEVVRQTDSGIKLVMVGSSDQYGNLGSLGANVSETTEMRPQSPYAVSKRAQEDMAKLYVRSYGMQVFMTRSFNHGGAGQRPGFMIPDFASGIVKIERGESKELSVGNLTSRRDFTHVRDMVRAYRLIAEKGTPGEVYNVGSGKTWSAQEVLDKLIAMARCPIPVRQDPARMRLSDTPVICCDHSKVTKDTGWVPVLPLEQILKESLAYFRSKEK